MALPVIEDCFRCAVEYTVAGQNCVNVLHVSSASPSTAATIADAVAKAWGETDSLCSLQSTSVNLNAVAVTPLDGESPTVESSFGVADNDNGTHSAFPMPAGDALVISLKTALRGRSHSGRLYLAGLCSNQMPNDQQSWSGSTLTAASAAWAVMAAKLDTEETGARFVVASYKLETMNQVVSVSPKGGVASQRRRDR